MQIEHITDDLNRFLLQCRGDLNLNIIGKFVVKREIETQKVLVYKRFKVTLYYVSPTGTTEMFGLSKVLRCEESKKEEAWESLITDYNLLVFKFIRDVKFYNIVHGIIS